MGEEAKPEQPVTEAKTEEKPVEEKKEEEHPSPPPEEAKKEEQPPPPPPEEEKKEEEPPKPPAPFVLYVDLHCNGCAKKIQKCIMKIRGVEGVVTDMGKNQVTIKGVVEPQAICNMIMKKTKRKAQVLSPLPANEGETIPEILTSQASGLTTVELNVNMHCEACAEQLKKKILKMRGVQTVETELSSGKVSVTGTMDANKLVDYVYRRTKKTARIVPQPEPKPEPQPQSEEPKPVEETNPAEGEKKEGNGDQPPPESGGGDQPPPEEAPKEGGGEGGEAKEVLPPMPEGGGGEGGMSIHPINYIEEDSMKRMVYYPYNYQPLYFMERIPPPQLFSDENPNACCIS